METEYTNLNIRIDKEIKQQADQLFDEMGLSLSTAINIFVRQAIKNKGIPFRITTKDDEDSLSLYDLPFIRKKLAEAQVQANDPETVWLSREEVMGRYREKYGYSV